MKNIVVILAVIAAGCSSVPAHDAPFAFSTEHFDVAAADPQQARRLAAHGEATWRLFADELGVSPPRARLVLVDGIGDGLYEPGRVIVDASADPGVLRHEIAHHFVAALLGSVPDWLNEGLAEYLQSVRVVEGRPVVSGLAAIHLDRILTGAQAPACRRRHADYTSSWWAVARLIEEGSGSLRERILALKGRTAPAGSAWRPPVRWEHELAETLATDRDGFARAAAARILARLGRLDALRDAVAGETSVGVRAVIAAELARAGEKQPLRDLLPEIECLHALALVSRSAGRGFDSVDDLRRWLE